MKNIGVYFNKLRKRENIIPILFSVLFTALFFLDTNYFHNKLVIFLWIALAIAISFIMSWLFVLAGFTVLRSLFLLSAELSLLIFLSQAYCDVHNHNADNSLKILIMISLLYIFFEFFKTLKKALIDRLTDIPEKKWSWEKIISVVLFVSFTLLFIAIIYQVVSPIISNLCVYKT